MKTTKYLAAALGLAAALTSGAALAGDPESCKAVRLSDVGWTDIQATTGVDFRAARPRSATSRR